MRRETMKTTANLAKQHKDVLAMAINGRIRRETEKQVTTKDGYDLTKSIRITITK